MKPGSAGVSVREGAHRLLALAMKGEWPPVDQVLKAIEKAVAAGGEDINTTPLSGVIDPVSILSLLIESVTHKAELLRSSTLKRTCKMKNSLSCTNLHLSTRRPKAQSRSRSPHTHAYPLYFHKLKKSVIFWPNSFFSRVYAFGQSSLMKILLFVTLNWILKYY